MLKYYIWKLILNDTQFFVSVSTLKFKNHMDKTFSE